MTSVALRITNSAASAVMLCLEPWGDEIPMPPGATFRVMAEGPSRDEVEVDVTPGRIAVWGWVGSVLSVFRSDGMQIDSPARLPVPPVPPGMSPRQFLDLVVHGDEP